MYFILFYELVCLVGRLLMVMVSYNTQVFFVLSFLCCFSFAVFPPFRLYFLVGFTINKQNSPVKHGRQAKWTDFHELKRFHSRGTIQRWFTRQWNMVVFNIILICQYTHNWTLCLYLFSIVVVKRQMLHKNPFFLVICSAKTGANPFTITQLTLLCNRARSKLSKL